MPIIRKILVLLIVCFFGKLNAYELREDEFYLPGIGVDTEPCWNKDLDNDGIKNCFSRLFIDLDFDGINEIIEINFRAGQRHRDAYTIYKHQGLEMSGNQLKPLDFSPFNKVDSQTIFNKKDKTIRTFDSGGACDFDDKTYQEVNKIWRIVKLTSANSANNSCIIETYEWNEESGMVLVDKHD
jgi:hypothetical protein